MIEINKNIIYEELKTKIEKIFSLPETSAVKIKGIVIEKTQDKDYIYKMAKQAVEISYHDVLSDIDMSVTVKLSSKDAITKEQYVKMLDRYGITRDCCLGFVYIPENTMYRIILRNGMRYDLGFEFIYDDNVDNIIAISNTSIENDNEKWPLVNIDRFWFVQVQALGKLYRNDFLIGDHLANININETLVQQMVLRDIKYGTNFHRYGNKEELEYLKADENECPYKRDNKVFNQIAAKIYASSITYDKLTLHFYPEYKGRKELLFDIWEYYDHSCIDKLCVVKLFQVQ